MADEIDRAQYQNELHQQIILDAWHRRDQPHQGRKTCLGCDEVIPARRRAANPLAVRCIECQVTFEKEQR